jgi:hypothetical protein
MRPGVVSTIGIGALALADLAITAFRDPAKGSRPTASSS